MAKLPPLIQKGQADQILGLTLYSGLASLVPNICIARKRLYPTAYIEALAWYDPPRVYTLAGRVGAFAATDLAQRLQMAAVQRTTQVLDSAEELTTTQVAELLCVSRETIANWYESGVIPVNRNTRQIVRRADRTPREFLTVPTAELRRIIVWHLPKVTK